MDVAEMPRWTIAVAALAGLMGSACGDTHLFFATYTKTGLHIELGEAAPSEAVFGYKRFEGAIIPVDSLSRDPAAAARDLEEAARRAREAAQADPQSQELQRKAGALETRSELAAASLADFLEARQELRGMRTTSAVASQHEMERQRQKVQDARQELEDALGLTSLYASNRQRNSWSRGMEICQVFATGEAARQLLAHPDAPSEELIECEKR